MALTPQDIARIAHLARLELSEAEGERMLTQLNGFFGIVEADWDNCSASSRREGSMACAT